MTGDVEDLAAAAAEAARKAALLAGRKLAAELDAARAANPPEVSHRGYLAARAALAEGAADRKARREAQRARLEAERLAQLEAKRRARAELHPSPPPPPEEGP